MRSIAAVCLPRMNRPSSVTTGNPDASASMVVLPPLLWYGFAALGERPALIANCPDLPHDPAESEFLDPVLAVGRIPYVW